MHKYYIILLLHRYIYIIMLRLLWTTGVYSVLCCALCIDNQEYFTMIIQCYEINVNFHTYIPAVFPDACELICYEICLIKITLETLQTFSYPCFLSFLFHNIQNDCLNFYMATPVSIHKIHCGIVISHSLMTGGT